MVRIRTSPIINAQNELDQWWLSHLDRYTQPRDGVYVFRNREHKEQYESEYIEAIQSISSKYGLRNKQLVKSTFDNYEIQLPAEPVEEPTIRLIDEPIVIEYEEIGIPIEDIQPDTPSEETKETEASFPLYNPPINLRADELHQLITELNEQLKNYRIELNGLFFPV